MYLFKKGLSMIKRRHVLSIAVLVMASSGIDAKRSRRYEAPQPKCATEKDCRKNKNCQCYCAEKGGFRKKVPNDKPVYVKDDPNGVYCYCKQWDLDAYPGPTPRPTSQTKKSGK